MPAITTPRRFAVDNIGLIRSLWRNVCDGDAESIHQARIATRRLRAALGISDRNAGPRIELCRELGHMLGAVREIDVTHELFATLETRVPEASGAIAIVRREVAEDQHKARTRFVKALEHVKLRPIATMRDHDGIGATVFGADWRSRIANAIDARQHALAEASERTPAVYMPNRLHKVRIAMKKLRYTLEVAEAAGLTIDARAIRHLRKAQDLLGTIHDLGVARRIAGRVKLPGQELEAEARVLDAVLAAECAALHERYLARRDRVKAVCGYCAHLARATTRSWPTRVARRAFPAVGIAAGTLLVTRRTHPQIFGV